MATASSITINLHTALVRTGTVRLADSSTNKKR